jgi:hypothetical protein
MPFLYFPDAISLILLLAVLGLLRSLAVMHIRQELVALRNEALLFWAGTGLDLRHAAFIGLRRRINSRIDICERLSPAFLWWIHRSSGGAASNRRRELEADYLEAVERELEGIAEAGIRNRILRFNLEGDVSFGTFYVTGSLSGWMLMTPLFCRMIIRVAGYKSGSRVDCFFDMAERVLSRAGRRAHLLTEATG